MRLTDRRSGGKRYAAQAERVRARRIARRVAEYGRRLVRGAAGHGWPTASSAARSKGQLAQDAGNLVEAETRCRRSLAQARQLSMLPLCEACEAALAALAALQAGSVSAEEW
jgi:hypothetical protein